MKNAIILCSGGMDSVVTAFYVKKLRNYEKLKILFFNYGQRSLKPERKASKLCAEELNANFIEIDIKEISNISNSLINVEIAHKKLEKEDLKNTKEESKNWYVPCRNLIFLSYSLALAESLDIREKNKYDIFTGFKNDGQECFPDATQKFVNLINKISYESTFGKYKVIAPLIKKDKEDIILLGKKLGVNLEKTCSCYTSSEKHCGTCLACMLRKEGFYWANVEDKTKYKEF